MASSSHDKGRIVEKIAASLHDWPGVRLEQNVWLQALHGRRRRREVDVLLHTTVAGYPVRIAIECKNESRRIGPGRIDAFIGKLQDLGIPPQHGVFISSSGYTKDALDRAQKDGLRALTLKGLSADGLKASIRRSAHQSVVFLLPVVEEMTIVLDTPNPGPPPLFLDSSGTLCGTIPHLLAAAWQTGQIPKRIGVHEVEVDVPATWLAMLPSGREVSLILRKVYARVAVQARAFTIEGVAEQYSLVDPVTSNPQKLSLRASFPHTQDRYALTPFSSEEALEEFLGSNSAVRLVQRVALPRLYYHSAFWPLSRRAADRLRELVMHQAITPGEAIQSGGLLVEGPDLVAAWETPMDLREFDEVVLGGFSRRRAAQKERNES